MSPDDHGSAGPEVLDPVGALRRLKPSRDDAEQAVRTLIEWIGDDPDREGLVDTPSRVVRAYRELFGGYEQDPAAVLARTFEETGDYQDMVLLRNVRIESFCEHHILPIIGVAHVAYIPRNRVVGVSKLARVVEIFARRLQIQEKLTRQIATTIDEVLQPMGVAVVIRASHQCMTTRGVYKPGVEMVTRTMTGCFRDDTDLRRDFLQLADQTA